jgi:3-oxoacyl-[acyl-carrier protein] reductase
MTLFKNQVAVVTGAHRGIGRAIAEAFAREAALVVLNDVCKAEDLEKTAAELSTYQGQCVALRADVSRSDQVNAMFSEVEKRFQRIDILVNNAGIIRRGSIETVLEEQWDQVIDVNLKGTFNCCKAAADMMIKQQSGKIINVSSIAGKTGDITSAPGYGPSKAAIDALTKTLARQLAAYNINVNGVAPHAIETDMSAEWSDEKRKAIIEAIPLKRLGQPQDVAEAVLFLASDKANFITGEILDVNGGFLMD